VCRVTTRCARQSLFNLKPPAGRRRSDQFGSFSACASNAVQRTGRTPLMLSKTACGRMPSGRTDRPQRRKSMTDHISNLARELEGLQTTELHDRLRVVVEELSLPERFDLLHRLGVYHHPESVSGAAATLEETAALREALPRIVERRSVTSVLDIPCGDFHWMQHVALDADYTGADVVPEIVAANQARHGGNRRRFVLLDATRDPLPSVDLILCRDLLIHLSNRDCRAALTNFAASGSRLLLTSHFASRDGNQEIVSGDFRPVNLCRAPFHFPPPLDVVNEASALGEGAFEDRSMALWNLADVAVALGR
jgi:SAM-dependent methyltransferase